MNWPHAIAANDFPAALPSEQTASSLWNAIESVAAIVEQLSFSPGCEALSGGCRRCCSSPIQLEYRCGRPREIR